MTKQNDTDDTLKRLSQEEQAQSDERINESTASGSDLVEHKSRKSPPGWINLNNIINSLPPEEQAEIHAGSKRIIESVIESRRASGSLRYLIAAEDGVYIARCLDVDIACEGDTRDEAVASLQKALELFFASGFQANITFKEYPVWVDEWILNKTNIESGQLQIECLKNYRA